MSGGGPYVVALALALLAVPGARAQPSARRVLLGLEVEAVESGWRAEIRLDRPFRYLRHAPRERGELLRVELEPLELGGAGAPATLPRREALGAAPNSDSPLREATWEAPVGAQPALELRFARPVDFEVSQGADFRSVVVFIGAEARPSRRGLGPPAAESDDPLLAEARRAITAGELDRAILLLRKSADGAVAQGDDATAAAAMELLGLIHERRGQRAHARAEYEEVLDRWPDSAVAGRVRQRLDALLLAQAPSRERLRETAPLDDELDTEVYGSLATTYDRFETHTDATGRRVLQSAAFVDLNAVARVESSSFAVRSEVAGSYVYDFLDSSRSDGTRISTLLVRASDPERTLVGTIGRQSRSDGGVLGRFDGANVAYRISERVTLSALAGLPLASSTSLSVQTDTIVFGGAVDVTRLPFGFDGQLFVVGQRDQGLTDRVAIGGELRYARPGRFGLVFLDYDVYFQSLNTFLVTGNFTIFGKTNINALIETRNAPVLTLGNALIGQPVDDLDGLRTLFTTDEIRKLAEDRTARSWTGSLGVTHALTEQLQLGGDITVSTVSDTPTSGGVLGTPEIGPETSFGVNATRSDFLVRGGFGSASLRYFDGDFSGTTSLLTSARFPVTDALRLTPRMRLDHRNGTQDRLALRPSLRADWRAWQLVIDAEIGLDWVKDFTNDSLTELGYFGELVVRWDF